jgi:hypothetical protein
MQMRMWLGKGREICRACAWCGGCCCCCSCCRGGCGWVLSLQLDSVVATHSAVASMPCSCLTLHSFRPNRLRNTSTCTLPLVSSALSPPRPSRTLTRTHTHANININRNSQLLPLLSAIKLMLRHPMPPSSNRNNNRSTNTSRSFTLELPVPHAPLVATTLSS